MPSPFETRSLEVAAFLLTNKHHLLEVSADPNEPRRKVFVFETGDRQDVQNYYNGAIVPAKEFAASLKQLKSLVYQDKDKTHEANQSHVR